MVVGSLLRVGEDRPATCVLLWLFVCKLCRRLRCKEGKRGANLSTSRARSTDHIKLLADGKNRVGMEWTRGRIKMMKMTRNSKSNNRFS